MKRSQEKSVSYTINLESAKIISQNTLKLPHINEELLYQRQPLHQNYYRTPLYYSNMDYLTSLTVICIKMREGTNSIFI